MQAERVETGWATVWILALVAEVLMLILLAGNLRNAQPTPLVAEPRVDPCLDTRIDELIFELEALDQQIRDRLRGLHVVHDARHGELRQDLEVWHGEVLAAHRRLVSARRGCMRESVLWVEYPQSACDSSQSGDCAGNGNAGEVE